MRTTPLLLLLLSTMSFASELDPGPVEDKLVLIPMSEIRKAVKMIGDYEIVQEALAKEKVRYADLLIEYAEANAEIERLQQFGLKQSKAITALTLQVRRRGIGVALGIAGTVLMFVIPATYGFLLGYFGG